jgi:hypothetical protein
LILTSQLIDLLAELSILLFELIQSMIDDIERFRQCLRIRRGKRWRATEKSHQKQRWQFCDGHQQISLSAFVAAPVSQSAARRQSDELSRSLRK